MQIGLNLALTLEHGGAGAPTLDMTFTGTGNELDSRITFTRASTATYFNSAGVLQSAAIDTPRFDYNPSTLAARGLLIEEARTNSIRNNTMVGAVAGTPGTLPTNAWTIAGSGVGTLTREIIGTGTVNGITYIDIRFSGTTSTTGFSITTESSTSGPAALSGQTWTMSNYIAMVGGSTSNITTVRGCQIIGRQSGGATSETFSGSDITGTISSTLTRQTITATLANATTATIQPVVATLSFSSGVAIDITLRIGLPQLENNNISTGVASATVAAGGSGYAVGDVLQIVGGTSSTAARLTVATLSGSAVATVTVSTAGSYSVFPSPQPVSVTAITGSGTSATFNIVPQNQTGFATSVIPTTTTALTRSADVASVNTLSPWFNATEGTLFAQVALLTVTNEANRWVSAISDGTTSNYIGVFRQTDQQPVGQVQTSAGTQAGLGAGAVWTTTASRKLALSYAVNDFKFCTNGGTVQTDTSGVVPTVTQLQLGAVGSTGRVNGWLERVSYYPRGLSNAELQALTA